MSNKVCKYCRFENRPEAKYCGNCGRKIEIAKRATSASFKSVITGLAVFTLLAAVLGFILYFVQLPRHGKRLAPSPTLWPKSQKVEKQVKQVQQQVQKAAYISLNTRPSGAMVFINGYFKARTPTDIRITSVTEVPRQYSIKLILSGYHSWERKVILTRGKTKEFSIKLVKK